MSAPKSKSISGCTEFYTCFWGLKFLDWPPLVMSNTLLGFSMVFLPQASLIWHHVFMFLPPLPIIHISINHSHFISLLFYTYSDLLPSFLHPPFPPIVSQTLPSYPHFRFFVHFMVILLLPPLTPTI